MKLELISKTPPTPRGGPPLLFVHGSWCSAQIWDEFFLDYFAAKGFTVHAPSLRGHGASEGRERLRFTRIKDYVADIESVVETLPEPPVLIGHSMGGFVVQKYLETHTLPGAVLLASTPPTGIWRSFLRLLRERPLDVIKCNLTLSLRPIISDVKKVHELVFSPEMPETEVARYYATFQDESFLGFLDYLALNLVDVRRIKTPMLVVGAQNDAILRPNQVEATARAYGVEPLMFDGMAHGMMLESDWRKVADAIIQWISTLTGAMSPAPQTMHRM